MKWQNCEATSLPKVPVLWIKRNGRIGYGDLWFWELRGIQGWYRVWGSVKRKIFFHHPGQPTRQLSVPEHLIQSLHEVTEFMEENNLEYFERLALRDISEEKNNARHG